MTIKKNKKTKRTLPKKAGTPAVRAKKQSVSALSKVTKERDELRTYNELQEKITRGLRSFISEMTGVFHFIESVSTFHSQDRILQFLMDILQDLCAYDAGALYLYHSDTKLFSEHPEIVFESREIDTYRQKLELDDRIYQWVFRQGHAVIVPDSFMRQKAAPDKQWSYMIAPLVTSNEYLGRIELLFKRHQGTFTQQTFSILNVLLQHAAVILVNERVYAKEKETAKKYIELDLLKQDVVSTTTHEIKTPLTIIQAAGILLERNRKLKKNEREQLLKKIIYQCERVNQVVTELFETSQIDESEPRMNWESVSLELLTSEVFEEVHYDASTIRFERRSMPDVCPVWADRSRMHKTLRNLIENAVKYSPQGGTILIEIYNQDDKVVWQIKDQGVGISEEDQKRIFDKFYRAGGSTTRSVRGMGFGLYLAKKNVELNRGKLTVHSILKEGATFTLEFPRLTSKE